MHCIVEDFIIQQPLKMKKLGVASHGAFGADSETVNFISEIRHLEVAGSVQNSSQARFYEVFKLIPINIPETGLGCYFCEKKISLLLAIKVEW